MTTADLVEINMVGNIRKYVKHCLKNICHTGSDEHPTILADKGADLLTGKRYGDWKSNTVAEGYVE